MTYQIYGKTYFGVYELIDSVYDYEAVAGILDSMDISVYKSYLVVRHYIKDNMDEVVSSGYVDMPTHRGR